MAVPLLQGSTFTVANPATERIALLSADGRSAKPALLRRKTARVYVLSTTARGTPLLPFAYRKPPMIPLIDVSQEKTPHPGRSGQPGQRIENREQIGRVCAYFRDDEVNYVT